VPGAAEKLTSSEYLKSCKYVGIPIGKKVGRNAQCYDSSHSQVAVSVRDVDVVALPIMRSILKTDGPGWGGPKTCET